jgi:hypothetical protein
MICRGSPQLAGRWNAYRPNFIAVSPETVAEKINRMMVKKNLIAKGSTKA